MSEHEAHLRERRPLDAAVALALYAAVSFAYFGIRLLPHPGRVLVGGGGVHDPEIFVWSFAWWPHAVGDLIDPFVSHAIYAPSGINLAWTTSVPGLALAFSPLTLAFGPGVSYNVAAILLPALAAWTAYLLCRYLSGSRFASLVGGYLFGFSSYILGHELAGHLNLTGVFVLPLVALVLVRYLNGDLSGGGVGWRIGVLLAAELWISTEVALTLSLALVVGLVLALWLLPARRARIRSLLTPIAGGAGLAALLASPLLAAILSGYSPAGVDPGFYDADLANLVVPTRIVALGGQALASVSRSFGGDINEQSVYLGLPALAMIALYARRARRSDSARFLLAALVVALVVALGTSLHVDGHALFALPWSLAASRPVLDNVLPARVAVYVSLIGAVVAALWVSSSAGRYFRLPYVLPLLAVASLVPVLWKPDFVEQPPRVPFFAEGLYKLCFPRGETLAIFPFGRWGWSPLWQAESGFWFRIAEGSLGRSDNYPLDFMADPVVDELTFDFTNPDIRPTMAQLIGYAERHQVDRIVSVVVNAYPDGTMMNSFGPVQFIGGVAVAPGCGYTSLTGAPGLPLPGEASFGAHASYTVLLDSTALLVRAERELLGGERGRSGALNLIGRSEPVLSELQADDRDDPLLDRGVELTSAASSALAATYPGPSAVAEGASRLAGAVSALRSYAREIDAGVAK